MSGSTIVNIAALAFGVALVTTIVSRQTTAPIIRATGQASSQLVLATLGIRS